MADLTAALLSLSLFVHPYLHFDDFEFVCFLLPRVREDWKCGDNSSIASNESIRALRQILQVFMSGVLATYTDRS